MREIKFRSWDANKKEMCRVLMIYPGDTAIGIQWIDKNKNICLSTTASKERVELMQFTGLKDKNGKEIYEGDVIEKDGETWQILWDKNRAGFRFLSIRSQKRKFLGTEIRLPESVGCQAYLMQEMTVIGNIYENQELI